MIKNFKLEMTWPSLFLLFAGYVAVFYVIASHMTKRQEELTEIRYRQTLVVCPKIIVDSQKGT
jgi:hypothetical protein